MFGDLIDGEHSDIVWPFLAALMWESKADCSQVMTLDSTWLATGDVCSNYISIVYDAMIANSSQLIHELISNEHRLGWLKADEWNHFKDLSTICQDLENQLENQRSVIVEILFGQPRKKSLPSEPSEPLEPSEPSLPDKLGVSTASPANWL